MKKDFMKNYDRWEKLGFQAKVDALTECVAFYDEKAVAYVTENLSKERKKTFSKVPVELVVNDIKRNGKDITFGDNVVYLHTDVVEDLDKKNLFFSISKCTICAVFVNLFKNTASDPNRKTQFGSIINGYFASITSEFLAGQGFENDMLAALEESLPALAAEIGQSM